MPHHLLAYLTRMRHILRWGLMRNTRSENNLEHSAQVALIAHSLALLGNVRFGKSWNPERVALYALYHDAPEVITGDIATPIKYFSDTLHDAFASVESIAAEKLIQLAPEDLQPEYRPLLAEAHDAPEWALVKAADRIAAYLKCVEEAQMGNREFARAQSAIGKDIESSPLPEVAEFMAEYVPSFFLTLDELN